ncbi:MAG: hypothetical protein ACRDQ2_17930 [Gaiellales bacterium]
MHPTPELLTEILAIAALVAGTLEYAIVVRHRVDRREAAREDAWGLRGLVRVTAAE